jgi:AcrR family transcriptional regulator
VTITGTDDVRPLRRDAEANLGRILQAARDVFAEEGYEASMEQIASRAAVGIGTLYRRFPRKADLLDAVVEAARERTRQIARDVLDEVEPGGAVFEFMRRCAAEPTCWRAIIASPPWSCGAADALARLAPLLRKLLQRSRSAGTIRPEVEASDLVLTLVSVRSIADLCDARAPGASTRFLELSLDGLRPGHTPPTRRPATLKELAEVFSNGPPSGAATSGSAHADR